jgi:hypothetical protein
MTVLGSAFVRSLLRLSLLAGVVAGTPASAPGEVYKWVDENGVAHYTTDRNEIPRRLRRQMAAPPSDAQDAELDRIPAPRGGLTHDLSAIPPPRDAPDAPAETSDPLSSIPPPLRPEGAPAGPGDPLAVIPPPRRPGVEASSATPAPPESAGFELRRVLVEEPAPLGPEPPLEPRDGTPQVEAAPPLALERLFDEESEPESEEIRALQARIDVDRERLRNLVTGAGAEDEALSNDPELRKIAERLPRLQAELEALRAERDR